ncbi:MAG: 3-deoxy-7-phosphoheptulonate synthase [Desulfobacteraceae bacterium]|nr:3-deoxy-7-phosphoheptulonate synthase [Desulfobacteraceae bacterium]
MNIAQTEDIRVRDYLPLMPPRELKQDLPLSPQAEKTVVQGRESIQRILSREDPRLLAVVGPCSIHDEDAALEYAGRLAALRDEVSDSFYLLMRVYFEKPRTTIGWKGLINDPHMDGSCDMDTGLRRARSLLMKLAEMGLPTATEMLEPITPQYLADLVSWSAIGARTTESQTHREMASGLSMAVGFKNGTDGSLSSAINALVAARAAQSFLGIDQDGKTCIVQTAGNPWGHIVLRGGKRPNYDPISIEEARLRLIEKGLPEAVMVDCSHGNSHKKYQGQAIVWRNVVDQYINGSDALVGLMLESHLFEGNQKYTGDPSLLRYGVSITDECISWKTTEQLLRNAHEKIANAGGARLYRDAS